MSSRQLALLVLGIWLIADAVLGLGYWHLPQQAVVLHGVALLAGVLLLFSVIRERFTRIGLFLLAVWLIVDSLVELFNFHFPYYQLSLAILAMLSGLLLILQK